MAPRMIWNDRLHGKSCADEQHHACHRHQQPKPFPPALRSGPFDTSHDIPRLERDAKLVSSTKVTACSRRRCSQ